MLPPIYGFVSGAWWWRRKIESDHKSLFGFYSLFAAVSLFGPWKDVWTRNVNRVECFVCLMGCLLSQDIDLFLSRDRYIVCAFPEVLERKWIILIRLFREVSFDYDLYKLLEHAISSFTWEPIYLTCMKNFPYLLSCCTISSVHLTTRCILFLEIWAKFEQ